MKSLSIGMLFMFMMLDSVTFGSVVSVNLETHTSTIETRTGQYEFTGEFEQGERTIILVNDTLEVCDAYPVDELGFPITPEMEMIIE